MTLPPTHIPNAEKTALIGPGLGDDDSPRLVTNPGENSAHSRNWRFSTLNNIERMLGTEDLYEVIGDSLPFGVWAADHNGKPSYASESFLNLIGISKADFRSFKWKRLLHPSERESLIHDWLNCVRLGTFWNREYRIAGRDGRWYTILSRGSPIRDRWGDIIGWTGVSLDLTEQNSAREKLRQSEERHRAIIDLASEGIWKTDAVGRTEFANRQVAELLGFDPERIACETIWDFVDSSTIKDFEAHWARLKTGQRLQIDCAFLCADRKPRWFQISSTPIAAPNAEFAGAFHILTDITARRETEEALKRAKNLADEANEAKSKFLANMSHEIRTPLGAILGFAELLRDQDQAPEDRRECVEAILRNGDLLLNLINDILDLSKVEAGRLEINDTPFPFGDLLLELKRMFKQQADSKGLCFTVEADGKIPEIINSDPVRLRQILINIIGNAIKFTDAGSVKARFDMRGHHLVIEVADTGIGIGPEDAKRLFTPFVQVDASVSRKVGGTGLGLVLSRNLARALSGEVALVESQLGKGSVFEIRILLNGSRPQKAACTVASFQETFAPRVKSSQNLVRSGSELEHVEILVVDDSADNRRLLQRMLLATGAHVTTVENGEIGYKHALSGRYDIILMDIQMPVMDGYEATVKLRESGYKGPIVALTAHAMKDERDRCISTGFNDHVVKPLDRNSLIETIRRLVREEIQFRL